MDDNNTFCKLFFLKSLFLRLHMLRVPLKKGEFYETSIAYSLALIHSTCSSKLQSEPYVTYANAPIAPSRLKNGISLHHYVT